MQKQGFRKNMIASAAIALAFTVTAQGGVNHTYVSTTGSDAGACSITEPCRTFTAALAATSSGGEIVVLDSGGFGAITITQPLTITAVGVDAAIRVTAGDAITLNTPGAVTINGLNLYGGGAAADGILVSQVGFLRLFNMNIENFTTDGIHMAVAGKLAIYNSKINDCGHDGLLVSTSATTRAYVNGSIFDNNTTAGVEASAGKITIVDSSAHGNGIGFSSTGGTLALYSDRAVFNTTGLGVNATGSLIFANCLIADNVNSWTVTTGGVLSGSDPATNLVGLGQSTIGTGVIGAATALQ